MAKYRKLSKTSDQRKALLRNQVTMLVLNGRITTTEARAKEIQKIAEKLIALAVKEKDNFETVTVKTKVAQITKEQITKIAEQKMPDLNAGSLDAAISMIAGTARSMGITVVD